jgi:serine/threonine protein kinase
MPIETGRRLGPYEILTAIGAGGMGEVYKARDTRLDRSVAIKVLPTHLADRSELRERFEREAKTIASLNHPHICTLFDTGHQDDIEFLVMEYIEGETLAQRLQKGPLPLQQVLQYAIEIADALDKAHRKGITHRDLKPGNIMLTKSGTKLLDFGLAKLAQDAAPVTTESQMPTMKDAITAQGTILGTLQYMAPEQVEGKLDQIDARTDIFAFGVVVYEMATGKKAFEGKTQASLMAKILETDPPPMTTLAPMTPPSLDRIVKRCLAKNPDDRWQSARDLCEELHWISDTSLQSAASGRTMQRRPTDRVAWAVATIATLIAVAALAAFFLRRPPLEKKQVVRFTIGAPQNGSFGRGIASSFSISPDGTKLTYTASAVTGGDQLWVRALDSPTPQALSGTVGGYDPFWSPDGQSIGFFADGKLKRVSALGGPVQVLAEAPNGGVGTWNRDGVILFVGAGGAINRVSESGGTLTEVATPPAEQSGYGAEGPHFLPDGKRFLYYALSTTPGNGALYAATLDSKDQRLILKMNSNVTYVSPGYLLYQEQGTIMARPFDANRLQLTGDPKPIAQGVEFNPFGGTGLFTASDNGVLAYRAGGGAVPLSLVWVNRSGAEQRLPAPPHNYTFPRISPDGQRVAVGIEEGGGQIWLYDIARDALSRLTFEDAANFDPVWTPDGKHITFKGKGNRLFWQLANGGGAAEELLSSTVAGNSIPGSWSPDGKELAFIDGGAIRNIYILPLQDRKPHVFAESQTYESAPSFSPDGKWMVYVSNESGRNEVYVRPYPGPGGRWQISTDGGTEAVWNPKGRELFYRQGPKMMAVDYQVQPTFSAGKPHMLFEGSFTPSPRSAPDYDVSPDGQRFLMLKAGEQSAGEINVVLNWPEQLKQKVATGSK